MSAVDATQLDRTFAALAHPARRAILSRLTQGQASVTELSEPFDISQPAISKHLKVLELAGLVERQRDAQWRPCTLRAVPLQQASDWLEVYRVFWEQRLARLDSYLRQIQEEATADE
ncbi:MAG: metalloregulator ArsR/SmtB family transcription factor [Candidatus Dormiibacterota bacterium]